MAFLARGPITTRYSINLLYIILGNQYAFIVCSYDGKALGKPPGCQEQPLFKKF